MWKYLLFVLMYIAPALLYAQQPKTMILQTQREYMLSSPSFFSNPVAPVNFSALLTVLKIKGAWAHVASEDMKSGWIHLSALTDRATIPYIKIGVSENHLGPKAETAFRASNPNVNYNAVDRMEKTRVSLHDIAPFLTITSTNNILPAHPAPARNISIRQEHYIGRAVTARLLHTYKPYDNRAANQYINVLGHLLSIHSDRPCTFSGYSFLIIDTLEPASFSASGGFVLISRGLLRCCPNEDAVAAVLAHEIAHVQQQHTLNLIKKSRLVPPKEQSSKQLSETLAGTANNIVSAITNSGHARKREREADRIAIQILKRTGFNPTGMQQFLQQLNKHHHGMPETKEHKTVHTDPNVRLKEIDPLIRDFETIKESIKRKARFDKSLTGI